MQEPLWRTPDEKSKYKYGVFCSRLFATCRQNLFCPNPMPGPAFHQDKTHTLSSFFWHICFLAYEDQVAAMLKHALCRWLFCLCHSGKWASSFSGQPLWCVFNNSYQPLNVNCKIPVLCWRCASEYIYWILDGKKKIHGRNKNQQYLKITWIFLILFIFANYK